MGVFLEMKHRCFWGWEDCCGGVADVPGERRFAVKI